MNLKILLIIAWALALGCNSAQTGRSQIDSALAAFIPADANMLAGIRMEEVRGTALYKKLLARQRLSQLDDFARRTGFDPRKDVSNILVGSNGTDTIVAARGSFNIRSFEGAKKSTYKGYTLYSGPDGGVALIDASTAIAGSVQGVRNALDRYKSGNRTGPVALFSQAREIPPQNQIWSVASGFSNALTSRIPESGNAANIGRIFRALENTVGAGDFRSGVNGYVTGVCRTEQDAKNLGDTARGLVGMARLSVPDNQPELLKVWDGIKIDQQQRTVKITVAIPQELVDQLMDLYPASSAAVSHLPGLTRLLH